MANVLCLRVFTSPVLFSASNCKVVSSIADQRERAFTCYLFCLSKHGSDILGVFLVSDLLSNPEARFVVHEGIQILHVALYLNKQFVGTPYSRHVRSDFL